MKKGSIKLLLFEIPILIMLILNNFVSSILRGYIEVLFFGILLVIFYFLFGFERDRSFYQNKANSLTDSYYEIDSKTDVVKINKIIKNIEGNE